MRPSVFAEDTTRLTLYAALRGGVIGTVLTLTVVFGTLRVIAARRPRLAAVDFEEAPVSHQTLNLSP